jgi:hypothetical protein
MPLEPDLQPAIDARWSFKVPDMERRLVAFEDESVGKVTNWVGLRGWGELNGAASNSCVCEGGSVCGGALH